MTVWRSEVLLDSLTRYRSPTNWKLVSDSVLKSKEMVQTLQACLRSNVTRKYELTLTDDADAAVAQTTPAPPWGATLNSNVLPVFAMMNMGTGTCVATICDFKTVNKKRCCVSYDAPQKIIKYKEYDLQIQDGNQHRFRWVQARSDSPESNKVTLSRNFERLSHIDALSATSAAFFWLVDSKICEAVRNETFCKVSQSILTPLHYSNLSPQVKLLEEKNTGSKYVKCGDGAMFNQHGLSTLVHCLQSTQSTNEQVVLFINYEETNFAEMFADEEAQHKKWPDVAVFEGSFRAPVILKGGENDAFLCQKFSGLRTINANIEMDVVSVEVYTDKIGIDQNESIHLNVNHDSHWQRYEQNIIKALDAVENEIFTSIVISSGGMKMAFAGCVALNWLKKKGKHRNLTHVAGVSGGGWALNIYYTHIFTAPKCFDTFMPYYKMTQQQLLSKRELGAHETKQCGTSYIWDTTQNMLTNLDAALDSFTRNLFLPMLPKTAFELAARQVGQHAAAALSFPAAVAEMLHGISLKWTEFVSSVVQHGANPVDIQKTLGIYDEKQPLSGQSTRLPHLCISFCILPDSYVKPLSTSG